MKSPEWLENKRATINPKNKNDNKCFQHTLTLALNHQNIERDDQRISKIKPFLGQYNCKDIDFHQTKKTVKRLRFQGVTNISYYLIKFYMPKNAKNWR